MSVKQRVSRKSVQQECQARESFQECPARRCCSLCESSPQIFISALVSVYSALHKVTAFGFVGSIRFLGLCVLKASAWAASRAASEGGFAICSELL